MPMPADRARAARALTTILTIVLAMLAAPTVRAQAPQGEPKAGDEKKEKKDRKAKEKKPDGAPKTPKEDKPYVPSAFFETTDIPTISLTSNFGQLRRDRSDNPPLHWASISYTPAGASAPVTINAQVRTRGIWRRKNCQMPPLRIELKEKQVKGTIFDGQKKPKLVVHCRDDNTYDQYLLQEYQAYRIYSLVSPVAHRARLAHVQYVDSASGKQVANRYAIFVEDIDEMAGRLGGKRLAAQGASPADVNPDVTAIFGLFQFMIGNTDFSISALHNVWLLAQDTTVAPVPYDYDFSGIVNTRYATPDPRLGIRTVREHLYRGYCVPDESLLRAVAKFDEKKAAILALYDDQIGKLMNGDQAKDAKQYINEFYETIDNPRRLKRDVIGTCLGQ